MLDQKKFLIIGGILAVVIVVTLFVVLTRKKDAPDTSGGGNGDNFSPVAGLLSYFNGNIIILWLKWNPQQKNKGPLLFLLLT